MYPKCPGNYQGYFLYHSPCLLSFSGIHQAHHNHWLFSGYLKYHHIHFVGFRLTGLHHLLKHCIGIRQIPMHLSVQYFVQSLQEDRLHWFEHFPFHQPFGLSYPYNRHAS